MSEAPRPLFRQEAIDELNRAGNRPSLLRTTPRWTRWTYVVVVATCAAAIVYCAVGTVDEYAVGPALIRAEGRREVTAPAAGTVAVVDVRPGERVQSGGLLVRLHDAAESADLERLDHEFELQLVKMLRDPSDQAARQALTGLRAQKELAEARLEERSVRAPVDGVVSDVRIRPGQHLNPGDVILTLVRPDVPFTVIAMLPGNYRPLLRAGMTLRLELEGYSYEYRHCVVDEISDEVVGPAEVKRYLGPEIADAVSLSGPVVLVQAALPTGTFDVDGRAMRYHDGMLAKAEARVRSERIMFALVPGLRALVSR
ncbi:MAG TPA: HlyD family efflux transporter periplasmic adaptor subunit [Polyangia bacterium]|jgi:membrane fusion protein (multidrug efflux system)|nr:HlyD family efflux transporter periplasmic adaptor subunit [Polyangia bacterium]